MKLPVITFIINCPDNKGLMDKWSELRMIIPNRSKVILIL